MDTAQPPDKQPEIDPKNELPAPHDMELPAPHDMELPVPHDMQLKPHLTQRHTWLHWLPALLGLFVGVVVGIYFTGDAARNREEINRYYSSPTPASSLLPAEENQSAEKDTWQTYTNSGFGYTVSYPPGWKYTISIDDITCCSTINFRPLIGNSAPPFTDEVLDKLKDIGLITVQINRSNETLDQVLASQCPQPACNPRDATTHTLNGLTAKSHASPSALSSKITILQKEVTGNPVYKKLTATIILHKLTGQDIFSAIPSDERLHLYEQMLASFRFLDPNPTNSPTFTPVLQNNTGPVYCTLETKQCPDGSWVSRVGPNCDFLPCTRQQP